MRRLLVVTLAIACWSPLPAEASSDDSSFLTVTRASVGGTTVSVEGSLLLNGWGDGSYVQPAPTDEVDRELHVRIQGHDIFDLGDEGQQLFFVMRVSGAGSSWPRPALAYSWPLRIDGVDSGKWLGAGNPGTGNPPATAFTGWGGICSSALSCDPLPRSGVFYGSNLVLWEVPYAQLGVGPGSTIELGGANGGVAASFLWPVTPTQDGTGALSAWDRIPGFKLKGEVRVGIAPQGTPADEVQYPVRATLGEPPETHGVPKPRSWTAQMSAPTVPGSYTIHAKTCWGQLQSLTCEHRMSDLTIGA